MTKIEYVDWGIANYIKDTIYLNARLKDYPQLHDRVLAHELEHAAGKGYELDWELQADWELDRFVVHNPSTWIQFLPIFKIDYFIIYNKTMIIVWILLFWILTCGVSLFIWLN